jgi:hypothetical protein
LFLSSVFSDDEQNVDFRLMASQALRRSEDVRIMPAIERPGAKPDPVEPPPIPLRELVEQRRVYHDGVSRELEKLRNPDGSFPHTLTYPQTPGE